MEFDQCMSYYKRKKFQKYSTKTVDEKLVSGPFVSVKN